MGERETTARAREVGNMLRSIREAAGLTTANVADRLSWSISKISRVERGAATVSSPELVRYAAHCGADIGDINHLLDWCQEIVPPGYWMSKQFASLIFHEATAAYSSSYNALVVPGLLQTRAYASALIGQERLPTERANFFVRARMMRQQVLRSQGCDFVIHEQALRLPVGGNRVMNEQLLQLLLLSNEPRITIRVVPTKLGERSYFGSGFVFYRYTGGEPLVHQDGRPIGLFVEDRAYVADYHELLAEMSDVALGEAKSRELIAKLASEFDRPEASPDTGEQPLAR